MRPMLKPFSGKNFSVRKNGPKMTGLGKGCLQFIFWFCEPKKAHLCAESRLFRCILRYAKWSSWRLPYPQSGISQLYRHGTSVVLKFNC